MEKKAVKAATKSAEEHLRTYLGSQEALTLIETAIQKAAEDEARKRFQNAIVITQAAGQTNGSTFSPPPAPPTSNGGPS